MIRLLVPGAQEGEVGIDGPRLHYVSRVLRLGAGDSLEVFDGAGARFEARVQSISPERAVLVLGARAEAPASRVVTIAQGLPKADKMEMVLQKGTELGASAFVPLACARSIVKLDGKEEAKRERWQRIVEEAARQSGRADVPDVMGVVKCSGLVKALGEGTRVLVLDEEEKMTTLRVALSDWAGPVAFVVGPEGGLSREEVGGLISNGAIAVTLGSRILRTETAALAALAVIRFVDGELG